MPSIFLCHSSIDKPFVRRLASRLRRAGVRVWLDEAEIKVGQSLTSTIAAAISEMDQFGVVLSKHSVRSTWVKHELQLAMTKEIDQRTTVVLPILLDKVEIPFFLRDKLYADFTTTETFESSLARLLVAMGAGVKQRSTRHPHPQRPSTIFGTHEVRLDGRGRVVLPERFVRLSGPYPGQYVVMLGRDGQIDIFPAETWESRLSRTQGGDSTSDRESRWIMRQLSSQAEVVELDERSRLRLSAGLREKATIGTCVILCGVIDHFEVWDTEIWKRKLRQESEATSMEEIVARYLRGRPDTEGPQP